MPWKTMTAADLQEFDVFRPRDCAVEYVVRGEVEVHPQYVYVPAMGVMSGRPTTFNFPTSNDEVSLFVRGPLALVASLND